MQRNLNNRVRGGVLMEGKPALLPSADAERSEFR